MNKFNLFFAAPGRQRRLRLDPELPDDPTGWINQKTAEDDLKTIRGSVVDGTGDFEEIRRNN